MNTPRTQTRALASAALWLACALSVGCGGDDAGQRPVFPIEDDSSPDRPDQDAADMTDEQVEPPAQPVQAVSARTRLMPTRVNAGQTAQVICEALDLNGETIADALLPLPPQWAHVVAPVDSVARQEDGSYMGLVAGAAAFNCQSNALSLNSQAPALLTILPGAPHTVVTRVDHRTRVAGQPLMASCEVFDAQGNALPDAMSTIVVDPSGAGVAVSERQVTLTRAGLYGVSCQVDGAANTQRVEVEVTPDLPANLVVGRAPNQQVYGIGQVITATTIVTDRYDNVIEDAPLAFTSTPAGLSFGLGRFRYEEEGLYRINATVTGPTHEGRALTGFVEVLINGTGPELECTSPGHAEMVLAAPNTMINVQGKISDFNGVSQAFVNGQAVTLSPDGGFSVQQQVNYGVNFVELRAIDDFGQENSRSCAFLASDRWSPEGQNVTDSVTLKLLQAAFDDGTPGGLNSLNDILVTVINSSGLRDTLHQTLLGNNPLKPESCDNRVLGACTLRSEVSYLNSQLNGPHTSSLTLVQDGLRLRVRVNNVRIQARINATGIGFIPLNTTGWATVSFVEVDLTSNLQLTNGRPRITLRQLNNVDVGNVSTDFSGFTGLLVDIVASLFQGTVRDLVRDAIVGYVNNEFNALLDSVLGNLNLDSLGSSFEINRLDGNGAVQVNLGLTFSSLAVSSARALFGVGLGFSGQILRAGTTRGTIMPAGDVKLDPNSQRAASAGIHAVVLNGILHTLWRGAFFDAILTRESLSESLPEGTRVQLNMALPPVVVLQNGNKLQLQLGAVDLLVTYPGLFDEPLQVSLSAIASTSIGLQNDTLSFGNIVIDTLNFSAGDVSLDATTRDVLEGFLRSLLQDIINQSLNSALPSLPIPSFTLPASLSVYGLPVGASLGLRMPSVTSSQRHFILEGDFGVQ